MNDERKTYLVIMNNIVALHTPNVEYASAWAGKLCAEHAVDVNIVELPTLTPITRYKA